MWKYRRERILHTAVALVLVLGAVATAAAFAQAGKRQTPDGHRESSGRETAGAQEELPLAGWVVLVDAGHGGYDGGARGRDSGVWEKEITLKVALQAEKNLTARGAKVIMTRREDVDLCEENRPAGLTKKRQDLMNRIAMAEAGGADMVLSIHMNEYRSRAESGPQVFYRAGQEDGRLLAGCMQESLIDVLQPPKERAALAGDYFVLGLDIPSVLIECGFLSNAREEALLLSEAYQARLGEAIARGAVCYAALKPFG